MSAGVTIWRCVNCRTGFFPERLLCARCHGDKFETDTVTEATVEEISVIRHMLGQENWQPQAHRQRADIRRPAHHGRACATNPGPVRSSSCSRKSRRRSAAPKPSDKSQVIAMGCRPWHTRSRNKERS